MKYKNPQGTLTEECMSWFAVFLFNILTLGLFMFIYLIYKKVWQHAVIYFLVSFLIVPMFIYPFYISSIVRKNYLTNGWIEISNDEDLTDNVQQKSKISDYIVLTIIIAITATIAIQLFRMYS